MAKHQSDLASEAKGSGDRQRAKAAALMEPGFMGMAAATNARKRTQPAPAQQTNASQMNIQNGSPSAMPTPYAKGGKVKGKCMKCGGAAHGGACKMAKGGKVHDDTAEDTKLFKKLYAKEEAKEPKEMARGGKAKLGSGARFKALKSKLAGRKGITNPGALAASIGRKKYGAGKMAKMSAAGRHAEGGAITAPRNKVARFAMGGAAKFRKGEASPSGMPEAPTKGAPVQRTSGVLKAPRKANPAYE